MQSADKQLNQLRSSIKNLNQRSKQIDGFNKLKKAVGQNEQAFYDAQTEVTRLTHEIKNTEQPTNKLTHALGNAQRKVNFTRQAYLKKRLELNNLRKSLKATGVDTRNFTTEQTTLKGAIDQLD